MTDGKILKIYQKKFYDGVFKMIRLQLCYKENSQRLFLEYVLKTSCFRKNILRRKSIGDRHHNKVAAL